MILNVNMHVYSMIVKALYSMHLLESKQFESQICLSLT